jgi:hypothetical protein
MYKTLLLGALASSSLGAIIVLGAHALNASGEVGGLLVVLGACGAGLIGGAVSRRLPPQRHH